MNFRKKSIIALIATLLILTIAPSVFAKQYKVDELNLSFELPDTWQVATRSNYDPEFVKIYLNDAEDTDAAWKNYTQELNYYLVARPAGENDAQYEIVVTVYEETNEQIDYDEMYSFELKSAGKASFEEYSDDEKNTFKDYSVEKGKTTNYIVFNYEGKDSNGKKFYGKFYHTVMNGIAIDFDLTAYKTISTSYEKVFDNAVLNAEFQKAATEKGEWYEISPRMKQNLAYIALAVLAIAFVTVIVIYIVSKVNEKKKIKQAEEKAMMAREERDKAAQVADLEMAQKEAQESQETQEPQEEQDGNTEA